MPLTCVVLPPFCCNYGQTEVNLIIWKNSCTGSRSLYFLYFFTYQIISISFSDLDYLVIINNYYTFIITLYRRYYKICSEPKVKYIMDPSFEFTTDTSLRTDCGVQHSTDNFTIGSIETNHPYADDLRCTWAVHSNCSMIEWRFGTDSLNVHNALHLFILNCNV